MPSCYSLVYVYLFWGFTSHIQIWMNLGILFVSRWFFVRLHSVEPNFEYLPKSLQMCPGKQFSRKVWLVTPSTQCNSRSMSSRLAETPTYLLAKSPRSRTVERLTLHCRSLVLNLPKQYVQALAWLHRNAPSREGSGICYQFFLCRHLVNPRDKDFVLRSHSWPIVYSLAVAGQTVLCWRLSNQRYLYPIYVPSPTETPLPSQNAIASLDLLRLCSTECRQNRNCGMWPLGCNEKRFYPRNTPTLISLNPSST